MWRDRGGLSARSGSSIVEAMPPPRPTIPPPPEGKRLTPAEYCWVAKDNSLGAHAQARDAEGWRVYAEQGRDVAAMTILGDELVLDFAPPVATDELAKGKRWYTASPTRPGWLRYRRPATRNPGPDLEANLGGVLGTASRERHRPPAFHRLVSAGGPYLCLPVGRVPTWGGYIEAGGRAEFPDEYAAYERVTRCPDEGAILTLADGTAAIVLGTPDALYWKPLDGGGVLARVSSFDADDDAALERMLAQVPARGWTPLGELDVAGPYRAFDAAEFGGAIGEGNSLAMALAPGRHAVSALAWKPDAGTSLLLVRLERVQSAAKPKPKPRKTR